MSCDGKVDFPLEEKIRLVEMLVYDMVNFVFKQNLSNIIEWPFVWDYPREPVPETYKMA